MKKWMFFALFCCAALSVRAQRTVLESENKRFSAMIGRDSAALERLLHRDLEYVHSNALQETKAGFIHTVNSGAIVYQALDRSAIRVQQKGRTAIVNGEVSVRGTIKGNPFDVKLLYLAVYRKQKGRWQLYRWQSTKKPV